MLINQGIVLFERCCNEKNMAILVLIVVFHKVGSGSLSPSPPLLGEVY